MKRLFLLFLFLLASNLVHAVNVPPVVWYNTVGQTTYIPGDSRFFRTMEAACRHYYDSNYSQFPLLEQRNDLRAGAEFPGSCSITIRNSSGQSQMLGASYSYAYQCPTGATLQSNSGKVLDKVCVLTSCPANTTLNTTTNVCDDVCLPNKGKIGSFSLNCGVDVSSGTGVCMPNNCAATVVDNSAARVGNCWFGVNNARYTGATCGGQPSTTSFSNPSNANPPPVDAPETNCLKDGKSFGYVNGVPVCVPKGSSSATPVKDSNQSTTTNSSTDTKGNTSSTTSSEVKNATQDGDQVTSSTTKTNADGTKTEETKTESVTSFCATNPTHPICKKAAQEEEEGPDPCEDNPDLPQCIGLGEAEEGGAIATSNKTVSFAPVQITSGGSCPPDKSVSIAGRSITFSYSWLCQYASMFKPFMLAFAYLSAAMFLFMGLRGANT